MCAYFEEFTLVIDFFKAGQRCCHILLSVRAQSRTSIIRSAAQLMLSASWNYVTHSYVVLLFVCLLMLLFILLC